MAPQSGKNTGIKFKTILLQAGKTATGIVIPDEIVENMGAGKKPPVKITINGYTYRNTVAVMGGQFMVGVSAEHRQGAGVKGGEEIEVTIELDTEPRVAEVPEDLQRALDKNKSAAQHFEKLSYSKKRALILPLQDAKTEETRKKRLEKTIETLNAGKI